MIKKTYLIAALAVFLLGQSGIMAAENFWQNRKKAADQSKGITSSGTKKTSTSKSSTAAQELAGELGTLTVKKKLLPDTYFNPNAIFIPVKYGEASEIFSANPVPARPSTRLIVNIQDIHCHYEAQKNIAHMLEEFIVNYGAQLILVEGNSKDASLAHLRKQASRARRIEVAEDYLKRGMISGEEYLDLVSSYDFKPLGIEDRDLYLKNLDSFLAIDKFKTRAIELLNDLGTISEKLRYKVFSKELLEFTDKKKDMEAEKLNFEEYCKYLLSKSEDKNLKLTLQKPNFDMVMKTIKLSEEISFEEVNKERNFVIDELSRELADEALNELLRKAKLFRNNEIKQSVFYNYLQELLVNKKGWETKFPELAKYIHYTNLHDTIDVIELFIELKTIEDTIKEKIYRSDDERTLDRIAYQNKMLIEIISLESAPYKYDYFQKNEPEFTVKDWVAFLDKLAVKNRLTEKVPQNPGEVDNNMAEVKNFYYLAYQRDSIFIEKTKKYMDDNKQNIAIMITGGFHSKHISQLFKKEGYSYIILSPKITTPVDPALYESVMKYKSKLIKR